MGDRSLETGLLGGAEGGVVVGWILGVEVDDYFFVGGGGEGEGAVIGGEREAAAAAVDEDGELDDRGAAVIEKFVEGGFEGAAGEEDVVEEDDVGVGDVDREARGKKLLGDGMAADVVAVEGDVEGAGGEFKAGGEAAGELDTAVGNAHEEELGVVAVTGEDGESEPLDGGVEFGSGDGGG